MRKPIPMHVGEIVTTTVKRLLGPKRMLITLKGHLLVAETERAVTPGEPITVQVLSIFPRINLRHLTEDATPSKMESPVDVQT